MANAADNYRPRGIGPKNQLTGTDTSAYAPWKWAIKDKLRIDAILYPTEMDKISYAFSQLAQPISQQLEAWTQANSEELTMQDFFSEVEHYMGIPVFSIHATIPGWIHFARGQFDLIRKSALPLPSSSFRGRAKTRISPQSAR